ncbi:fungal-specific transcription factor domain-containing protein [Rhypophila decipiens]|uniref:Fungal-specific transcription factor domain-containing protein n=1 Tax=Rhypophila decipiens TaxID=261697 RepID=A0AAN6Y6R2_9PEZI|nr:fungal-specific transcription factor domain-containing protein [Rhypophila decipiens]
MHMAEEKRKVTMKNRQKSRSGCRTCKLRRLRCDETKPGCKNCAQKGFECPGYQQRLQWSTKHERSLSETKATAPLNFTQLVTAASESIIPAGQVREKSPPERATTTPSAAPASKPASPPKSRPASASPAASNTTTISTTASPATSTSEPAKDSTAPTPSPPSSLASTSPNSEPAALVQWNREATSTPPGEFSGLPSVPMWQPVVNIPSFLIEHWFKSVCGSWSAYDSMANPYRRLTSNLWSKSPSVYFALQAISAASLAERLPHVLRDTARTAPRQATEAIKAELAVFLKGPRTRLPAELLLSLFCLSSSMCWMEARELGLSYVRQARRVLSCLDRRYLSDEERELLSFFNGCLIYEEMLRSVVSDDDTDINNMLSWPEPAAIGPLLPASPHAWTGVSQTVLRLFGKAIALCRKSRSRWRQNDGTSYRQLQGAMKDIEDATIVEEALLAIDIQDQNEPNLTDTERNLHDATEAYRLSSLLQLYETFPDLIAKRIPDLAEADGSAIWEAWVAPLALHVTSILERIPSGSLRCIQPLLCLCAGTGLRFDAKVPVNTGAYNYLLTGEMGLSPSTPCSADLDQPFLDAGISEASIKTSRARHFIMQRLGELELTLPPKPIGVAKQLLRAVWTAYDAEVDTPRRTHWLDVMSLTGLHSLFG